VSLNLPAILVFGAAALAYASLIRPKGRAWVLLIGSVVAIYWLQPALPIRFSDYILPTLTIGLAILTWWVIRVQDDDEQRASVSQDRLTLAIVVALVIALAFMRFVDASFRITASRPPSPLAVIVALLAAAGLFAILARLLGPHLARPARQRRILTAVIILLLILFVILKTEASATLVSRLWRGRTGQDTSLAGPLDLAWLGFSFVAFRLIHTLRDRQSGILPALSLREYLAYVLFFPAYTAGPIDRAERFAEDFRALPQMVGLDAARFALGLERILIGLFKKFVIADTLARGLSLNAVNAAQADSAAGLWLLLYGYAIRLYLDFAGYSDIAIGIGILFGVKLPENFNWPYLRTNITAFWQSWHMTLSSWVRFYVFTPLSRWLLRQEWRPSNTLIILTAHLTTMSVIGLWHGVTLNFFMWGLWHGVALFVHMIWRDRTRTWYRGLSDRPAHKAAWTFLTWFLTLNYVVIGWVWFALPTIEQSLQVLARLFGIR
jgi:alginate O-acetyltransferase complex protein AlgI